MEFPLLKLPGLAFENLVTQLEPADVIELTMVSAKFKRLIQMYKLRVHYFTWSYPYSIEIYSKGFINFRSYASLSGDLKRLKFNKDTLDAKRIEPKKFGFLVGNSRILDGIFEELTMSILKVKNFNFEYRLNRNIDISKVYIWKYCKKISIFEMKGPCWRFEWTPEDLCFILENIESESIELQIHVKNFQYKKPLKSSNIDLVLFRWFSLESLLESDCKRIELKERIPNITVDLNVILLNWMSKQNDNLESFIYKFRDSVEEATRQKAIMNVTTTPTIFRKFEIEFRAGLHPFVADGVDIRRATDGRRATVIWTDYSLQFYVWHEKNLKWCSLETKEKIRQLER